MSRETANTYYKQAFGDPSQTNAAERASLYMWPFAAFIVITTVACPIFTQKIDRAIVFTLIGRVSYLVALSIIFYRVN